MRPRIGCYSPNAGIGGGSTPPDCVSGHQLPIVGASGMAPGPTHPHHPEKQVTRKAHPVTVGDLSPSRDGIPTFDYLE